MITGVCLNPSFDKTVEVDALALGEVNRIRSVRVDMGGKGVNVAVVARRLGLDALCIGCMGEQGAQHFTRLMDEEGLPHRFLTVPGAVRANLKVVSRDGKGVTELNEPGAPLSGKAMEDFFALAKEEAARSEYVVLTGSLPPGCPDDTYGELIRAMGGTRCILDAGGPVLRLGAEAGPFLIKPNLAELEQALGAQLRTLRAIRDAALIFLRKGHPMWWFPWGPWAPCMSARRAPSMPRPCGWRRAPPWARGTPWWAACSWACKRAETWRRPSATALPPALPA